MLPIEYVYAFTFLALFWHFFLVVAGKIKCFLTFLSNLVFMFLQEFDRLLICRLSQRTAHELSLLIKSVQSFIMYVYHVPHLTV